MQMQTSIDPLEQWSLNLFLPVLLNKFLSNLAHPEIYILNKGDLAKKKTDAWSI